ncbi:MULTISPECIES: SMI1/KNR4 family protein [unclassified Agromyces]|uniref:SMI1/KNR4 family protein n=1 Tax=unclassified Agromyces TaxID=2639701 RepID=UPI003014BB82
MADPFEPDDYYTGPRLQPGMVEAAERHLGVRLPRAYTELLRQRNGGTPLRRCFPTDLPTSWAPDHFEISAIRGIGGAWGIDSTEGLGSIDMIAEWGYPAIGVVICDTPSGGHDAVMLDYSGSGPDGDPSVAYVDEDRIPRRIAASFDEFFSRLIRCDEVGARAE